MRLAWAADRIRNEPETKQKRGLILLVQRNPQTQESINALKKTSHTRIYGHATGNYPCTMELVPIVYLHSKKTFLRLKAMMKREMSFL